MARGVNHSLACSVLAVCAQVFAHRSLFETRQRIWSRNRARRLVVEKKKCIGYGKPVRWCCRATRTDSLRLTAIQHRRRHDRTLSVNTDRNFIYNDSFLKISFNLRFNSILPLRCVYTFFSYSHCELCLLRFVSGELNAPEIRHPYDRHMAR